MRSATTVPKPTWPTAGENSLKMKVIEEAMAISSVEKSKLSTSLSTVDLLRYTRLRTIKMEESARRAEE
jgi:hypothetical protein